MTSFTSIFDILISNSDAFHNMRMEIIQNVQGFFKYFNNPTSVNDALKEPKKIQIVLKILGLYFEYKKFDEESLTDIVLPLTSSFLISSDSNLFRKEVSKITHYLFKILNKKENISYAFKLFNQINKNYNKNTFINTKAYCIYYAYQVKNYSEVNDLLSIFSVELDSKNYDDHVDYCMYHFFLGLIALSERNFFKATIHFLCSNKSHFGSNFYSAFQMESLIRLILLSYIVDDTLKKAITEALSNKTILLIRPVSIYDEFNKLLKGKTTSYREVEKYYKDNKGRFIESKTKGLVKICIKEFIFNKLSSALKTYKRINIDKLCIMLEMDQKYLISCIKNFLLRNKINVKVNEKTNVLEVLDDDFDEKISVEELKSIYSNLNQVQFGMVNCAVDRNLISQSKLHKSLSLFADTLEERLI